MSGILLLFLLTFLLLGPKKTSELARKVGKQVGNVKRAARELQNQLENTLPTSTLDDRLTETDRSRIYLSPSKLTVPGRKVEEIRTIVPVESPLDATVQVSGDAQRAVASTDFATKPAPIATSAPDYLSQQQLD